MTHYAVQTQEIFSKSEQYRKWEGVAMEWGAEASRNKVDARLRQSKSPECRKPAPSLVDILRLLLSVEAGRSALPFKKGTANGIHTVPWPLMCSVVGSAWFMSKCTPHIHGWACLSCTSHTITSQKFCSLLSLTMFDMSDWTSTRAPAYSGS